MQLVEAKIIKFHQEKKLSLQWFILVLARKLQNSLSLDHIVTKIPT